MEILINRDHFIPFKKLISSKSFFNPVGGFGSLLFRYAITFVCLFFNISSWAFCCTFSYYLNFYYFVGSTTGCISFGGGGKSLLLIIVDFGFSTIGGFSYFVGEYIISLFIAFLYYYFFILSCTTLKTL